MVDLLELPTAVSASLSRFRDEAALGEESLRLVVAVSGGEDSRILLHVLDGLRRTASLILTVAHLDHSLRVESERDARFVAALARQLDLPAVVERAERPIDSNENVEAWARRERYSFLASVRERVGAHAVVTAHHRDDQAETVLFRILSGRFPQRRLGMVEHDRAQSLLRPLLQVSKQAIEDYGIAHQLEFVVDASNADCARTRNRIRHELLPALAREYNPQIVNALVLQAERYERDERYFAARASEARAAFHGDLGCEALNALPEALRLRVLAEIAADELGADAQPLGMRDFCDVSKLVAEARPERRVAQLGHGIECAVSRNDGVHFSTREMRQLPERRRTGTQQLPIPGFVERRYADGGEAIVRAGIVVVKDDVRDDPARMRAWIARREEAGQSPAHAVEYFDLEQLPASELLIRERQLGDRMRVFRRGERKLKKLFLERGVPLSDRDSVPIVESDTKILWVPGVARSDIAPVRLSSRYLLELRYNFTPGPGAEIPLRA